MLMSKVLKIAKDLFDIFYPIGSYYETSNLTWTPQGAGWYGTWVKDSKGRVTVALDDSDADFNTISKTGGEKTHTLTVYEMPSHNHPGTYWMQREGYGYVVPGSTSGANRTDISASGYAGGNQPHNNLQPYIVVVRWHRTA